MPYGIDIPMLLPFISTAATVLGAYFAWRHKRELSEFIENMKAKDKDRR
jgi:hypothetical protein